MKDLEHQIELQEEIQKHGINLISCSHCDTILFHRTEATELTCWGCKENIYPNECGDYYYNGMPETEQVEIDINQLKLEL